MMMISRRACLSGLALAVAPLAGSAAAAQLELVMFERPGCSWCVRWKREIGDSYGESPEAQIAPLRIIDLSVTPRHGLQLREPVRYTPTFVAMSDGVEAGRITGYIDNASFWGLYARILEPFAPVRDKPEPV